MDERPASRERAVFDELVELPLADRERVLAECSADDPMLRARVKRLLDAESGADRTAGFLDDAFLAAVGDLETSESRFGPLPRQLGQFRLLSVLGEGGMGVVFEAEQEQPHRRVALKVMRSDLVSSELVRRFRREVDTLGRLQHPGIAQIHEAGSIVDIARGGDPVPYISMELVRGPTLDEHVRRNRLEPRAIADLIAAACDAAHHAHQRGVVHRDLKPANVLVVEDGPTPTPKILDFGIARIAARDGQASTLATSAGQILGTLAYMSPEQLAGDPSLIDARTDVYALGVILYELLAGTPPFDVRDRPIADAARIVREEEPTRLGLVDPRLRGDIETIVSKAIEKDPDRRYPSAAALAEELRRYQRDEPILAKPTTRLERLYRFTRRNRPLVFGTVATILALAAGTTAASIFAGMAILQRRAADWKSYRASVSAGSAALSAHDVVSAERHLQAAPEEFRGWEWRYLRHGLDQSDGRLTLDIDAWQPRPEDVSHPDAWVAVRRALAYAPATITSLDWPTELRRATTSSPSADASLWSLDRDGNEVWFAAEGITIRSGDGSTARLIPASAYAGLIVAAAALNLERTALALLVQPTSGGPTVARFMPLDRADTANAQASIEVHNRGRHLALAAGPGALIALGGGPDGLPVVWDARSGHVVSLTGHTGDINAICLSDDGAVVATGGADRSVRLFDVATGRLLALNREHLDQIQSVRFSSNGALMVSASADNTVRLWSVPALEPLRTFDGHAEGVRAVDFSADGAWAVSAAFDHSVRAWRVAPGAAWGEMRASQSSWGAVDIARDAPILVTVDAAHAVGRWDMTTGQRLNVVTVPRLELTGVAVSPRGDEIVVMDVDGHVIGFRSVDEANNVDNATLADQWRFEGPVASVGYLADGRAAALVEGNSAPSQRLRLLPSGEVIPTPLPQFISSMMISSNDGRVVAVRDVLPTQRRPVVVVLDGEKGSELLRVAPTAGGSFAFGTLPDGRVAIATASSETELAGEKPIFAGTKAMKEAPSDDEPRVIVVRDARTGARIRALRGHTGEIFGLAFAPDGSRLMSGGRDRLVRVWDTSRWDEVVPLPGHTSFVWALRFSRDGDYLATGGGDRAFRVWRAP
ncbi:MAG: serine/threonine-protein kinase [Phycisphaerae bacterium]|nr:serine/threonine-protein kinase [Phycisphaerae bacterium]